MKYQAIDNNSLLRERQSQDRYVHVPRRNLQGMAGPDTEIKCSDCLASRNAVGTVVQRPICALRSSALGGVGNSAYLVRRPGTCGGAKATLLNAMMAKARAVTGVD